MSVPADSDADRLESAAALLRAAATQVQAAAGSFGDTPLDEPVALFCRTWTTGLNTFARAVDHLAAHVADAGEAPR